MSASSRAAAFILGQDPQKALRLLDAIAANNRLIDFTRLMWPVLEPSRRLKEGKVLHVVCEHLEAVTAGQIRRLLINIPPGCMKSLLTNVLWPAWCWGPKNLPHMRFIGSSYAETLSLRDNVKCRRLISSDLYREFWGNRFQLTGDQNAKGKFENDKTGFKLATSVGGTNTGERGDVFAIDDPNNVKEAESDVVREGANQWMSEVVPTRLNSEDSAILCIMQRVHEHDVSGHILASDLGYDHLCLPMQYEEEHPFQSKTQLGFKDWRTKPGELLFPELYPLTRVEEEAKALSSWGGSYAVAGQHQQRPAPRGGGMFKRAHFRLVPSAPPKVLLRVRGWDLAASDEARSPYTVGLLMSRCPEGRFFIEDVRRIQGTDYEVEQLQLNTAKADGNNVVQDFPQDPGQAGKTQVAAIARLLAGYLMRFSPESGDKEDRARPLAAQVEAGNVYLVQGPWNEDFLKEAAHFPASTHKDQIDAASRAFSRLIQFKGRRSSGGAVVIGE